VLCDAVLPKYTELYVYTVYRVYPDDIAIEVEQLNFTDLIRQFIHDQEWLVSDSDTNFADLPAFYGKITVYPSAVATFHAPSDISGVGGMQHEHIRAVKSWRNGPGRYDTVFVNVDSSAEGMHGLDVARVRLFFSFSYEGVQYPCTLVHWFSRVGDSPDDKTGMWIVEPVADGLDDKSHTTILHLDTIVRGAHLLPVFGHGHVSQTSSSADTLDRFTSFYVNKYADHHSFKIAF
jgi:hypothetical protein